MALWRIRATVDDRPGYLSVLTASLALRGVNILSVQVHTTEAGAVDDFLVDAPDAVGVKDLVSAVERGRGRDCWVARSEARVLVDQPTRALGLATRLVRDPDALGESLRALLGASAVTWRPVPEPRRTSEGRGPDQPARPGRPAEPDRRGYGEHIMWLPDPAGGSFEVTRTEPSFTPAEYARAQALVDLAAAVGQRAAERVTLVLADGAELTVRPATPDDAAAVRGMHRRCSTASRRHRYLDEHVPSGDRLARLLDPASGVSLVAVAGGVDGAPAHVVAMANLVVEGDLAEAALLVEDGWQHRGLGGALLRRLAEHAGRSGHAALVVHTEADNAAMLRILDRLGPTGPAEPDAGLLTITVPLAPPRPPAQPLPRTGDQMAG
jgi:GNAT superfamily N-acetyltransferase